MGIRAYALVGFCIISLLFTQFAFAQQSPEDCGPNQVFQLGVCQDIDESSITWDKSTYKICDTGIITISAPEENTDSNLIQIFTIQVTSDSDPSGQVIMIETGNDTGVFTGSLQLCVPDLHVLEGDKVYATYGNITVEASIESTATSITVSTDRSSYQSGDTITITGKTSMTNIYVTMLVSKPNGNIISVSQISPDYSGAFGEEISTTAPTLWDLTGTYTVSVQQGESNIAKTTFYFESVSATESITVSTDRTTYDHNSMIFVNGKVTNPSSGTLVTLIVISPNNDIVTIDQLSLDTYDNFNTRLSTTGILWKYDGTYTIRVQYGSEYIFNTVLVKLTGGITPEPTTPKLLSSNPRIVDEFGNPLHSVSVYQQVQITVDLENPNNFEQSFVYYIKVREIARHEAWISGSLAPGQSFSPALSWTPSATGTYTIDITIFDDIERRNVLAPTLTLQVVVDSGGGTTPTPTPFDTTPPLLLTPSDITIDASDSSGARVDYSVKAIDDEDGILRPNCSPSSGSLFPIGETTVTCSATDSSGNSARKSFVITVNSPDVLIPSWIRDVAGFWCDNEIDDNSFIEAIQYLINNDVIIVPATSSSGFGSQEIPSWIKNNACWWSQGLISNSDFASGLQYLIGQGIIKI